MAQWIYFKLIDRPYYDHNGDILTNISGRKNRKGIDEINGGGKVYPDLSKVKVIEWTESGLHLLVLVDGSEDEIKKLETGGEVVFMASPKYIKSIDVGLSPRLLSEEDAMLMKIGVFELKPESGVTK